MRSLLAEPGSNRLSHPDGGPVAAFVFGGRVPCAFDIVDSNVGTGDGGTKTDVVEQEEFWFWPEQHGVSQTGRAQILFSALSNGTRVAIIALQGAWFQDVAADDQRRFFS